MSKRTTGDETADSHLCQRVTIAKLDESIAAILSHIRHSPEEKGDSVYIVDGNEKFIGVVSIRKLFGLSSSEDISRLVEAAGPTVRAETDQEVVANLALRFGLSAVPVLDNTGKFLGVIPSNEIMHILRREHVEDLHRLAGIRREVKCFRETLEARPVRKFRDRIPWLLIGFGGSAIATLVTSSFEAMLTKKLSLAYFLPGIVYLADAIGTQTETVVVRSLSLTTAPFRELLGKELGTGALLGVAMGGLGFLFALLLFQDRNLAICVGLSLFIASTLATVIGLLFPYLFQWLGKDPAFGSGPVATVLQDILSLGVYLVVAHLLI